MPEPKTCERCGERFGCGAADGGCWCADVAVPGSARRDLAARYRDCLCPTCLRELASGSTVIQRSGSFNPSI
jgi:hypothetical protein